MHTLDTVTPDDVFPGCTPVTIHRFIPGSADAPMVGNGTHFRSTTGDERLLTAGNLFPRGIGPFAYMIRRLRPTDSKPTQGLNTLVMNCASADRPSFDAVLFSLTSNSSTMIEGFSAHYLEGNTDGSIRISGACRDYAKGQILVRSLVTGKRASILTCVTDAHNVNHHITDCPYSLDDRGAGFIGTDGQLYVVTGGATENNPIGTSTLPSNVSILVGPINLALLP